MISMKLCVCSMFKAIFFKLSSVSLRLKFIAVRITADEALKEEPLVNGNEISS